MSFSKQFFLHMFSQLTNVCGRESELHHIVLPCLRYASVVECSQGMS